MGWDTGPDPGPAPLRNPYAAHILDPGDTTTCGCTPADALSAEQQIRLAALNASAGVVAACVRASGTNNAQVGPVLSGAKAYADFIRGGDPR